MKVLTLLLVPAALFAAQARFARLGDFEGKVEVQTQAADPWAPAERNLPLSESAWVRTGPASRVEMELDEGSAWRLGPDSLAEISDYSRLSTGQRVTLLSLDRGIAYFTGEPQGKDSLSLAVPGAQLILFKGARIRIQALETSTEVAVIEGAVKFSAPQMEMDLLEGQAIRFDPANAARFSFFREAPALDLDRWSEDRDKALFRPASAGHVVQRYGVTDLDRNGEWTQTDDLGAVWKPKVASGWAPYQKGRWRWYDALGYTWVSDEPWGWLPYHFGRWALRENLGWVWAPAKTEIFKPAEVYWLRGAKLAGWGPLAPGENWSPTAPPRQFLNVNTTYAAFAQDARVIDPAGFTERPKEPLGVAVFTLALPSPAFPASRLDAVRPALRAGSTRVVPSIRGVSYDPSDPPPEVITERRPAVVSNPGAAEPPIVITDPPPDAAPPPQPVDVIYPAPSYTGIVVVNPPENPDYSRRRRPSNTPPQPAPVPAAQTPAKPAPRPPGAPPGLPPTLGSQQTPPVRVSPPPAPAQAAPPSPSATRSGAARDAVKSDSRSDSKSDKKQ